MTTWADIQRLASDLQRVQLAEGSKKLSENNVIEVVSKLINMGAIDIIFTNDGREYITRKHLLTEVRNECLAAEGRIAVTDLATHLNVSLNHIDSAIATITKHDSFVFCAGELISRDFLDSLFKKLNDKLREVGHLSVRNLTKSWDLPMEILNEFVLPELGRKVEAVKDDDELYTYQFMANQKSKLRAVVFAIAKVTPLSALHSYLEVSPSVFFTMWNELSSTGEIPGTIMGSKSTLKSLYIPKVYENLVKIFVQKSFSDKRFIEHGVLKKLAILEPKEYFEQVFSKKELESVKFFSSIVISKDLWDEITRSVEESLEQQMFGSVEEAVAQYIPTSLEQKDLDTMTELLLKSHSSWRSTDSGLVYDVSIVESTIKAIEGFIAERAERDAPELSKMMKERKGQPAAKKAVADDDDDEWSSGKGGKKKGGKKSTGGKKSNQGPSQAKQDTAQWSVPHDDLLNALQKLDFLPPDLVDVILQDVEDAANAMFREKVEAKIRAIDASGAQDKKKEQAQVQAKLKTLYDSICLFDQGAGMFEEALAQDLRQYLLKSLCIEASNLVLSMFVELPNSSNFSQKVRDESISSIPEADVRQTINNLYGSLTELEKFHNAAQSLQACSIMLKPPDKKAKQEAAASYAQDLRSQLQATDDPPACLLLAVLIVYAEKAKVAIHASGKFVAPLTKFLSIKPDALQERLAPELLDLLDETQQLVVKIFKAKGHNKEENENAVHEKIQKIKSILFKP